MQFLKKKNESVWVDVQATEPGIQHQGRPFIGKIVDLRAGFKAKSLFDSFSYAWDGILYATQTQRNFRVHLCIAVCVITASLWFHVSNYEWALLAGMTGLVLFAELMNTAIELFVDMLTEGRFDERAKAIKDMSAGAVLIAVICAVGVGLWIFVPHLNILTHG